MQRQKAWPFIQKVLRSERQSALSAFLLFNRVHNLQRKMLASGGLALALSLV